MTTLLASTQNLSKSFGATLLFKDISFGIFTQDRLGLIGPNGSGKSTLLKILANLEEPDLGEVILKRDTHVIYLSQTETFPDHQTIEQALNEAIPSTVDDTERFLRLQDLQQYFAFPDSSMKLQDLSGGWKKKVAIAQALLQKPDLLLLDEPTNHLDLESILWLENFLKNAPFSFILISHDRTFLENTTNKIIELNKRYPEGFLQVKGTYSDFIQRRDDFIHEQSQKEQILSNKLRREVEWLKRGPKARTTKAQYRIDAADQLKQDLNDVKGRNRQNETTQIDFTASQRQTKKLLEAIDITMERGGNCLFKKLSFTLSPKKCLGVLGNNGSGKSTLFQCLNGQLTPTSGIIQRADHLKIVTFDQQREQLNPNQTLKQALTPSGGDHVIFQDRPLHVVSWAKKFLFPADQLGMPVAQLSGGEKSRVLIANLMLQPADILLLDEPTNDLDIPTLEILESSLDEFTGALVLITHDRYLMDRLSDEILFLDGKGNSQFFADYFQWLQHQESQSLQENISEKPTKKPSSPKKMTYEEQKEYNKIEGKIEKAEALVQSIQQKMATSEIQSHPDKLQALYTDLQEAESQVETLYMRWEELESKKSS